MCRLFVLLVLLAALTAGCGGSTGSNSAATTTSARPAATTTGQITTAVALSNAPGGLRAEANATAAGDIPDNQVFLVFRNAAAHYSMKYPEGWAQSGGGDRVTFRDKNNIVRVVITPGGAPTQATVQAEAAKLQIEHAAEPLTISAAPAFKLTYSTVSAPNAVTGKRVKLIVDRYYLWHAGRRAVVDLGTPVGVDNVDAYRMMIQSFRWG